MRRRNSNAAVDEAAIEPDLNGVKVLVVDDEEDSLVIVQRILERRGAEVRAASSMIVRARCAPAFNYTSPSRSISPSSSRSCKTGRRFGRSDLPNE
jgi:hypothetical protein